MFKLFNFSSSPSTNKKLICIMQIFYKKNQGNTIIGSQQKISCRKKNYKHKIQYIICHHLSFFGIAKS